MKERCVMLWEPTTGGPTWPGRSPLYLPHCPHTTSCLARGLAQTRCSAHGQWQSDSTPSPKLSSLGPGGMTEVILLSRLPTFAVSRGHYRVKESLLPKWKSCLNMTHKQDSQYLFSDYTQFCLSYDLIYQASLLENSSVRASYFPPSWVKGKVPKLKTCECYKLKLSWNETLPCPFKQKLLIIF